MKPGKHQRSKQRCQDLCWKVHDRAQSSFLFAPIQRFYWLVFRSAVNDYCVLCTVKAKREREKKKHATKNFVEFHYHSHLFQ